MRLATLNKMIFWSIMFGARGRPCGLLERSAAARPSKREKASGEVVLLPCHFSRSMRENWYHMFICFLDNIQQSTNLFLGHLPTCYACKLSTKRIVLKNWTRWLFLFLKSSQKFLRKSIKTKMALSLRGCNLSVSWPIPVISALTCSCPVGVSRKSMSVEIGAPVIRWWIEDWHIFAYRLTNRFTKDTSVHLFE